jgi:hypothetical protein
MVQRRELRVVGGRSALDELPEVLTVEEAAYELARQWRETEGRNGLPVVTLGRSLRVPREALRRLLDVGPDAQASGQ